MAVKDIASFSVHFIPSDDGGYSVEVPALPGCLTEGDSFEEAEHNVREAIGLYVESLQERGLPIPDEQNIVFKNITVSLASSIS